MESRLGANVLQNEAAAANPQPMTMMPSLGKTQVPRGCANFERFLLREIQVCACTGSEGKRGGKLKARMRVLRRRNRAQPSNQSCPVDGDPNGRRDSSVSPLGGVDITRR